MTEIEIEIDRVIASHFPATKIERLPSDEARVILTDLHRSFLTGNPSPLWQGLRSKASSVSYQKSEWAEKVLAVCERLDLREGWLILESDSDQYPVYRFFDARDVVRLLSECSFVEFYLVDLELRSLVADTDHNELLVAD